MRQWPKSLLNHIYAHRGYHDKPQIPENSLPAFRRAIERGWGAELDVHLLSDGTLAVFHDSDLQRCTGAKGNIEDLNVRSLKELRLEGTDNSIPLFDEVLELFEESGCPLIIELKAANNNHKALAREVCLRLDSYRGDFCLESFDFRVILEIRRFRPEFIRGQLAQNYFRSKENISGLLTLALTGLWSNVLTRPDFIAYKFSDRNEKHVRKAVDKKGLKEVSWTIRTRKDFDRAIKWGCIPIFEKFDPEENEI